MSSRFCLEHPGKHDIIFWDKEDWVREVWGRGHGTGAKMESRFILDCVRFEMSTKYLGRNTK